MPAPLAESGWQGSGLAWLAGLPVEKSDSDQLLSCPVGERDTLARLIGERDVRDDVGKPTSDLAGVAVIAATVAP